MAILSKGGRVAANISQPFVTFTTVAAYNAWVATLPSTAFVDNFAILKKYGTEPPSLTVDGLTTSFSGVQIYATTAEYDKGILVTNGDSLYLTLTKVIANTPLADKTCYRQLDKDVYLHSLTSDYPAGVIVVDVTKGASYFTLKAVVANTPFSDATAYLPIGGSKEVHVYDAAKAYPSEVIVVNGAAMYLTLKPVPAGTALGDGTFYQVLGAVDIPKYTQAQWKALATKPPLAIITDSMLDN